MEHVHIITCEEMETTFRGVLDTVTVDSLRWFPSSRSSSDLWTSVMTTRSTKSPRAVLADRGRPVVPSDWDFSFLDQASVFQLEVEELLQSVGTLAVLAVRLVVLATVGDDPLQVGDEKLLGHVVSVLQPLRHGLQVCGSGTLDCDKEDKRLIRAHKRKIYK